MRETGSNKRETKTLLEVTPQNILTITDWWYNETNEMWRFEYCGNSTNEARRCWFVVGTPFPVRVKRVNFSNEVCPSSPALAVIWCDWMEFREKGNNWEPNRDGVELMFVNHWVSGSQPSLDIQRANNSLCFSQSSERSCSWLPKCRCKEISNTHTWSADKGVSPSESCRHRPSDTVSRHLETEAVFKLHYQCSLSN